jgi:hypothetical protein
MRSRSRSPRVRVPATIPGPTVAAVQDGNVSAPERPLPGQAAQLQMVHVKTGKQCWICKVPMKVVSGKFGRFWTCSNYWVRGCRHKQWFHEEEPEEGDEAPRVPPAAPAGDFAIEETKEPSPRASQAVKAIVPQAASGRGAANVRAVPEERVPPAVNEPLASLLQDADPEKVAEDTMGPPGSPWILLASPGSSWLSPDSPWLLLAPPVSSWRN